MTHDPGPRLAVLRNRDFSLFVAARFLATLAVQMQTVAVGWQVYEVTRDPLDLGLVGLSQFLPFVLLILPAGHVADNHDRRRILALCFALECVCALLLLGLASRGFDSARPVFAVMVLFGIARAFAMPTGQALLPNLVSREQFGTAVALNSSTWQVATIAGPALGGVVYLAGAPIVYATVAVTAGRRGPAAAAGPPRWRTGAGNRAARLVHAALGAAVRTLAPPGAGRNLARSLCGAVRRRDGIVARLRRGRPARGADWTRAAAYGARASARPSAAWSSAWRRSRGRWADGCSAASSPSASRR